MTGVNMRFEFYNENPAGRNVGDCTVRAISKALGQSWDATYWNLCIEGNLLKDMPSSNAVGGAYLRRQGFERDIVRDDMSVADFAAENPHGTYILALSDMWSVRSGFYYI